MSPVATPNVSVPKPSPSAINTPIPAGEAQVPSAPPSAPAQGASAAGAPAAPDAGNGTDTGALFDQAEQMGAKQNPSGAQGGSDLFDQAEQLRPSPPGQEVPEEQINPNGEGADLGQRVSAEALGRSPEEQRRILAKGLGDGFETRLGGRDGKSVLFRKVGEDKFRRMDPGFFNSLSDFGKDLTAFGSRVGIDAASAIAGEALGIAGGAAVGGPVGAGVGAVAGAGLGGAVAAGVREAGVRALGVEPAVDVTRNAAFNALLNAGTLGAGALIKTPLKAAVGKLSEALSETAFARVSQLSKIREGLNDIQAAVGFGPKPNAAVGKSVSSAVDQLTENLGAQIGAVNDKALAIAGTRTFPVTNFQAALKSTLSEQGVTFSANGKAVIGDGLADTKPFGAPEGVAALKDLVKDYNQLASNNGAMNLKQLTNTLSYYQAPAGFSERLPSAVNGAYQVLRGALREERDKVLPEVLAGTPEGDFAKSAYANYASKIDTLRELQDKALRKGSPEKFAEALITPKDSAGVQSLKATFGEDSAQFSAIKSSWFSGIIDKAVDPETGIVSGAVLKKQLTRYGDDVTAELLSPAQKNAINVLANNAEKISYAGLIKNPENSEFVRRIAGAMTTGFGSHPEGYVRTLWSLFSSNKAAIDYLSNDGLLRLAKETSDPAGRTGYVRAADWLGRFINGAQVVVGKNGNKSYSLPINSSVTSAIINANVKQSNENTQQFLQRKQDTLSEVTGR